MVRSVLRAVIPALVAITGMATLSVVSASRIPETVSPSGPTDKPCPTFSWSAIPGATAYELVVYGITPDGSISDHPALSARLPQGASSWTPPADACLEPGNDYGWSIRAVGPEGHGKWSDAALIEYAAPPSIAEVEAALGTLNGFLMFESEATNRQENAATRPEAARQRTKRPDLYRSAPGDRNPARRRSDAKSTKPDSDSLSANTGEKSTRVQAAAMKVEGEVRTVDEAGSPRLWGKGRPGTEIHTRIVLLGPCETAAGVRFGLSRHMVDWHSAAHACPAGSWVCTEGEIGSHGACNTNRPDSSVDGRFCSGNSIDFDGNAHGGWLANANPNSPEQGVFLDETGTKFNTSLCQRMPVWCCF